MKPIMTFTSLIVKCDGVIAGADASRGDHYYLHAII